MPDPIPYETDASCVKVVHILYRELDVSELVND